MASGSQASIWAIRVCGSGSVDRNSGWPAGAVPPWGPESLYLARASRMKRVSGARAGAVRGSRSAMHRDGQAAPDVAARRLIHGALDANAISAPTHCSRQVSENSDTTGGTADSGLARGCAATPSNEPGDTLEA